MAFGPGKAVLAPIDLVVATGCGAPPRCTAAAYPMLFIFVPPVFQNSLIFRFAFADDTTVNADPFDSWRRHAMQDLQCSP